MDTYVCIHIYIRTYIHTYISGMLLSTDSYMNIQMDQTKEYIDDKFAGDLGEVCVCICVFAYYIFGRIVCVFACR